jgi:hypothetical protein
MSGSIHKFKVFIAAATALLFQFSCGFANAQDYYKSEASNFMIRFKCTAPVRIDSVFGDEENAFNGDVIYSCDNKEPGANRVFLHYEDVYDIRLNSSQMMRDSGDVINDGVRKYLTILKYTKQSSRDIRLHGFAGKEIVGYMAGSNSTVRKIVLRFYLVANKLYIISLSTDTRGKEFNDMAKVNAFLDSFDLLNPDKAKAEKAKIDRMVKMRQEKKTQ